MLKIKNKNMKNSTIKTEKKFFESDVVYTSNINRKSKKKLKFFYRLSGKVLPGHIDCISCIKRHTKNPSLFFSGGFDGEIKIWTIGQKKYTTSIRSRSYFIKDLAVDCKGLSLISSSEDHFLKIWTISQACPKIKGYFKNKLIANSLSSHPSSHFFASAGKEIFLWDLTRFQPIQKLLYKKVLISKISFNPFEHSVVSSCAVDNSILLFDFRLRSLVSKISLTMPSNDISWSLIDPRRFAIGNEDGSLYFFDTRNLKSFLGKLKSYHVPIVNIDQNPKYNSIISNSCGGEMKLFTNRSDSLDNFFFNCHMKKIHNVCFSLDGRSIVAGSDDGDFCVWENFQKKNHQK